MYIDAIDDMDVWSDFATKECSWNGHNVKPLYMREQDASIVNAVFSWDDRMTATPAMSRPSQITQEEKREKEGLIRREVTTKWKADFKIWGYEHTVRELYDLSGTDDLSRREGDGDWETDIHDRDYE